MAAGIFSSPMLLPSTLQEIEMRPLVHAFHGYDYDVCFILPDLNGGKAQYMGAACDTRIKSWLHMI